MRKLEGLNGPGHASGSYPTLKKLSKRAMTKRFKLSLLLGCVVLCLSARSAYADNVVLTGGSVSTVGNVATINLVGDNFSLNYSGDIPGGSTSFGINSVTLSLGLPNTTFNGTVSNFFAGSLSFTNTSLTGSVTAYASMQDLFFHTNPLFSVTFSGTGVINVTNFGGFSQTQFTVTPTSVPEPAALLQLFAGLTSGGVLVLRRYGKTFRS